MGSRRGHSFTLGLHTTIFQAERYAIKVRVMENTENGHKGRNIYVLSYSQAATKAQDSFRIHAVGRQPTGRLLTVVLCHGLEKNGMVRAWHGHGIGSVDQTRPHCVNQMGKDTF